MFIIRIPAVGFNKAGPVLVRLFENTNPKIGSLKEIVTDIEDGNDAAGLLSIILLFGVIEIPF